jgi:hypothetical protein
MSLEHLDQLGTRLRRARELELGHYYQSQQSAVRLAALDAHANSLAELRHAAP